MKRTNFHFDQIISKIQNKTYPCIGSGSARQVYDLENGYVVKVAKNKKGLAQNKAEYKISSVTKSNLFAKIPEASADYYMLIMEKADKIRDITYVWNYFRVRNNRELLQTAELKAISDQHDLLLADLGRPENWGKINARPYIIDYGYTRDVMRNYYSLRLFYH